MNETQIKAVNRLFALGYERGFYPLPIKVENYLVPTEYNDIRFS